MGRRPTMRAQAIQSSGGLSLSSIALLRAQHAEPKHSSVKSGLAGGRQWLLSPCQMRREILVRSCISLTDPVSLGGKPATTDSSISTCA